MINPDKRYQKDVEYEPIFLVVIVAKMSPIPHPKNETRAKNIAGMR